MRRIVALIGAFVVALSGCSAFVAFHEEVDDLGKQIVSDWKRLPAVADAGYQYVHGIDSGDQLHMHVTLKDVSSPGEEFAAVVEIATEDYWRSKVGRLGGGLTVSAFSTDKPPRIAKSNNRVLNDEDLIHESAIEFDSDDPQRLAELEAKYGPRPQPDK